MQYNEITFDTDQIDAVLDDINQEVEVPEEVELEDQRSICASVMSGVSLALALRDQDAFDVALQGVLDEHYSAEGSLFAAQCADFFLSDLLPELVSAGRVSAIFEKRVSQMVAIISQRSNLLLKS